MRRSTRRPCRSVLRALAGAAALGWAAASCAGLPAGWQVDAAPTDSRLAGLAADDLIDRLVMETDIAGGSRAFVLPGVFSPIAAPAGPSGERAPRPSPAMTEIVRRGIEIIPALLDHLSDPRPTHVVLDPKELQLNGESGPFTDVYDYRFHENGPQPAGVNARREPGLEKGRWPYVVKEGDLCFVALGRIVNRRLIVAGPDFGDGRMFDGAFMLAINSPVETPALAVAARADWGGLTPEGLAAGLKADALGQNNPKPAVIEGVWHPAIDRIGGLTRLLFYFPDEGSAVAGLLLRRPLVHWALPVPALGADQPVATDSEDTGVVAALAPFRWDGRDAQIFALYERAVDEERKVIAARPATGRLASEGYDLPLACARRLVHRGHDEAFREFFAAAIARANGEYPGVLATMREDIMKEAPMFHAPPGSPLADVDRRQKEYRIAGLQTMLQSPIAARMEFLQLLGPARP